MSSKWNITNSPDFWSEVSKYQQLETSGISALCYRQESRSPRPRSTTSQAPSVALRRCFLPLPASRARAPWLVTPLPQSVSAFPVGPCPNFPLFTGTHHWVKGPSLQDGLNLTNNVGKHTPYPITACKMQMARKRPARRLQANMCWGREGSPAEGLWVPCRSRNGEETRGGQRIAVGTAVEEPLQPLGPLHPSCFT